MKADIFLWNAPVLYELYMIKWQAILLRINSFPPRTHERIYFLPRGSIAPSFFKEILEKDDGVCRESTSISLGEKGQEDGETILGRKGIFLFQP